MAEVICLCNNVFDVDLREYLDANPISSIEELREQASICNKCMQCQDLVEGEIYLARYVDSVLQNSFNAPNY